MDGRSIENCSRCGVAVPHANTTLHAIRCTGRRHIKSSNSMPSIAQKVERELSKPSFADRVSGRQQLNKTQHTDFLATRAALLEHLNPKASFATDIPQESPMGLHHPKPSKLRKSNATPRPTEPQSRQNPMLRRSTASSTSMRSVSTCLLRHEGERETRGCNGNDVFRIGDHVQTVRDMKSNSKISVRLPKGTVGVINQTDECGDIVVDFTGTCGKQWIFKKNLHKLQIQASPATEKKLSSASTRETQECFHAWSAASSDVCFESPGTSRKVLREPAKYWNCMRCDETNKSQRITCNNCGSPNSNQSTAAKAETSETATNSSVQLSTLLASNRSNEQQSQPDEDVLFSDSSTDGLAISPCSNQDLLDDARFDFDAPGSSSSLKQGSDRDPTSDHSRDTSCSTHDVHRGRSFSSSQSSQQEVSIPEPDDVHSCAICFEGYENSHDRVFLPCCHSFHFQCVETWISTRMTCPTCRHPVNDPGL